MDKITDGNKLIAVFMGGKPKIGWAGNDGYNLPKKPKAYHNAGRDWWSVDALAYHLSWDWLMPVVEKIEGEDSYRFVIFRRCVNVEDIPCSDPMIEKTAMPTKIQAVYESCVEFIQWYNTQNKQLNIE